MSSSIVLSAVLVGLVGCQGLSPWLSVPRGGSATLAGVSQEPGEGTVLSGRVDLAALGYRTQATIGQIATAATVSVIDIDAGNTVATALTDANGFFQFSGGGLRVTAGKHYFLEAIKGLGNHVAGSDACRVRTIIRAVTASSFASITGSQPGSAVAINESTTALSIIDTLRSDVAATSLIGTVSLVSGGQDTFTPGSSGVTVSEFSTVRGLVAQALASDVDPFLITRVGGAYGPAYAPVPVVTSLTPNPTAFGRDITVQGANFAPSLAGFQVLFGALACTVVSSNVTTLVIRLPAAAAPGSTPVTQALTVKQGLNVSPGVNLTLLPLLAGAMPAW
ncbi:MAG: IPT/TIG domain-containing protein [bacterium]|nr:IPT/TIG domain-containing protein [bacterium]